MYSCSGASGEGGVWVKSNCVLMYMSLYCTIQRAGAFCNLLPIVMLQDFFSLCQNTTVHICKCWIRVQVIPRGIPTRNGRHYQMSLYSSIAVTIYMKQNMLWISAQLSVCCSPMHTAENASGENVFFKRKEKKNCGSQVWPEWFNMKTGALKLYFFTREYNVCWFPMALLSFPNLMQTPFHVLYFLCTLTNLNERLWNAE